MPKTPNLPKPKPEHSIIYLVTKAVQQRSKEILKDSKLSEPEAIKSAAKEFGWWGTKAGRVALILAGHTKDLLRSQ